MSREDLISKGKMLPLIFIYVLRLSHCVSYAIVNKSEKCSCFDFCEKNFTSNSFKDLQKINACQRGCRFYSLALHTSHEQNPLDTAAHARKGCLTSCSESYKNLNEALICKFGCTAVESKLICDADDNQIPEISFSFLIKESDVLIHPAEPETDDSLTDPGLRKQIQKTLAAIFESTPKIPEIHFRNLPIRTEKLTEFSHSTYKCPKFYGFDSKLEFRNGKIIIGDLYLFVAVFVFVAICFIVGHHIENKRLAKELRDSKKLKKKGTEETEPLLKIDLEKALGDDYDYDLPKKEPLPDYDSDKIEKKFDNITLVFHDDPFPTNTLKGEKINLKM